MRLDQPRVKPLSEDALSPEQADVLAPLGAGGVIPAGPVLNIFRTLAHAPNALKAFLAWGNYVLSKRNDLPAREREIVILRTGYLCKSGYEWTQHVEIGLRCGLTVDEIARIKAGSEAGWSRPEAALIRAADELNADQFIGNQTWSDLLEHFSEKQAMDVVFTAGQYTQVCMMLNTFGVQLDPGQTLDPDLRKT
ncbi:carboxymuconolactone decarboxylase family protein [Caulobacter henricii]|uniref:Carboxymuconolactone decarboxylase n=1 Tax=Caulobacter henricii TaxID=69395 RepID=A0A0P0P066_9CAUL|nr:carboxymuconolactone decarboxylase family protein [Caulobacter henricii]ALL13846.1 carboxymuconolactone decarboxylase [Caulobacter henricii]